MMTLKIIEEVLEYIRGLSSLAEREQIAKYLERQRELGHRLVKPVSKSLREGIHEIRPGPHRLLFFYATGMIVIVHAFRKKTRKTPGHEIDKAINKRRIWQHENL